MRIFIKPQISNKLKKQQSKWLTLNLRMLLLNNLQQRINKISLNKQHEK